MDVEPIKVCPMIHRESCHGVELLAFEHPLAGKQWVKGTIEPGERPLSAALRELEEEGGITGVDEIVDLGIHPIRSGAEKGSIPWQLYLAKSSSALPDFWDYATEDDHGHVFSFFWHPAEEVLTAEWHPMFHEVYTHVWNWLVQEHGMNG